MLGGFREIRSGQHIFAERDRGRQDRCGIRDMRVVEAAGLCHQDAQAPTVQHGMMSAQAKDMFLLARLCQ